MRIVRFDSLESTNKYCEVLDLAEVEDFTCYWALEQTAGIGQRLPSPPGSTTPPSPPGRGRGGYNHWHSTKGLNLTISLVLKPTWLPADRQFKLTQALSLAVTDFLSALPNAKPSSALPLRQGESPKGKGVEYHKPMGVQIKWPNDIYVGGKKICGMLTSARLAGDNIATAICGIGLNINETEFPDWVPNPTSLRLLTGETYDLEATLHALLECIERRYNALRNGADNGDEYLSLLYKRGMEAQYLYQGRPITATITGVDTYGRLLLTAHDGTHLRCAMKEIAFL